MATHVFVWMVGQDSIVTQVLYFIFCIILPLGPTLGSLAIAIEGGPPEDIVEAFDDLFTPKIAATKIACASARAEMGWPARLHSA